MTGVAWWSQTAANNATFDSTINMAEGMAPSAVNDGVRALMASTRKWADDIAGATVTGGTSTALTLSTYQQFDTLARLNGNLVAFTPHATNGATVTLNCDGLGAKPLRSAPSVELPAGVLVQGTPYVALYNSSDAAFYLQGFYGNPYSIPVGGFLEYSGTTAPNSNFVLSYGQAISRTTYSALFSIIGTTFGAGDGSTTFNVPDLRGRFVAGADGMGGVAANRLTDAVAGIDSLGDAGGSQSATLVTANLPPYTPTVASASVSVTSTASSFQNNSLGNVSDNFPGGATDVPRYNPSAIVSTGTASITMNAQGGTSAPFSIIPPTIVLNKILRVI
jgi:microcystin-dependent protein